MARISVPSFRLAGLTVLTGALAASAALMPAWVVAREPATSGFHATSLQRQGVTVIRDLPSAPSGSHPQRTLPTVTRHLGNLTTGAGGTSPSVQVVGEAAPAAATSATAASQTVLASFPGTSLDQQITGLGAGQNVAPPDTQLAAGPTSLLEMVNDSGSVWSKSGVRNSLFDLAAFFHVPSGQTFSDPRVIYDAPSGRWFASGLSFTSSLGSTLYIAVSSSSDPAGTWTVYSGGSSSSVLHDQPKIGVSADKVVMSWNDFLLGALFEGASTWVVQKSDLLNAAASAAVSASGPDSSKASPVPVQELGYASTDTTAYDVYDTPPDVGVLAITGTPAQGDVSMAETDLNIGATSTPPSADQPGAAGSIDTNDDRFLSAVWRGGVLVTSGNDACVPSGDTTTRPCARIVMVNTSGNMSVSQDLDLASTGADLYYPAATLDSGGNLTATYAISSTSVYPGVRVVAESGGSLVAAQTLQPGMALYNDDPCYGVSGPSRWGDYSAAAVDAANPADVWVAGEFSVTSTLSATSGCAWATFAAQLTVTAAQQGTPSASVSPPSLSFASQLVTTPSSAQTVTVSNAAGATGSLTVSGLSMGGANPSDFLTTADQCTGRTLAPGSSCTAGVEFVPTAAGTRSATLDINDNDPASPQTVSLGGTGLDFSVSPSPSSVSFAVTRAGAFTVTVTPSSSFSATFAITTATSSTHLTVTPTSTSCTSTGGSPCSKGFSLAANHTGTYTVTISVTDGGVTHRATVSVNVTRH